MADIRPEAGDAGSQIIAQGPRKNRQIQNSHRLGLVFFNQSQ